MVYMKEHTHTQLGLEGCTQSGCSEFLREVSGSVLDNTVASHRVNLLLLTVESLIQ